MSRYYILGLVFLLGLGVGTVVEKQGYLGLALGIFSKEKVLAEVPLDRGAEELEVVGVDDDFIEKKLEIEPSKVEARVETAVVESVQSVPRDIVFNLDFSGATIRLEADSLVLENREEDEERRVVVAQNVSNVTCSESLLVPQHGGIFISEVNWMGDERLASNEWIELKNTSQYEIDVTGWNLVNEDRDINVSLSGVIKPRELFLLERGDDNTVMGVSADVLYNGALSNTGDNLYLFDEHCNLIDEMDFLDGFNYGDKKSYKTMERKWSNLGWQTAVKVGGTPRSDNTVVIVENKTKKVFEEEVVEEVVEEKEKNISLDGLYISEVMAGSDLGGDDEFVELYNPTGLAIELSGWSINKKSSTGNESSLVSSSRLEGLSVLPNSYFLIGNDEGYKGAVSLDATWAKSNTIAYSSNSVVVYNADGEVVDEVSWEEISKNKSYEYKDGVWGIRENPEPQNSAN